MGLPAPKRCYSFAEYLQLEENSDVRHEFHDGEILAMAGGTRWHDKIFMNLALSAGQRLIGSPCVPYSGNKRVQIRRNAKHVYPDMSIVGGEPKYNPDDVKMTTLINPKVIIEILSESTESYDRGDKFSYYREIPSFEEYVLVSQGKPMVETFLKEPDGSWRFDAYHGMSAQIILRSVPLTIPAGDIYRDVQFEIPEGGALPMGTGETSSAPAP
jgi:Uma2 family endonuclease